MEFGLPARSRFGEGRDLDIGISIPVWFRLRRVRASLLEEDPSGKRNHEPPFEQTIGDERGPDGDC